MANQYDYYGIYRSCRDAAWRCLLEFGADRLPVKVLDAARQMNIHVVRDSNVRELRPGESGASIFAANRWIVVYDDSLPPEESRMVLAHELGHILMGHEYKYANRRFEGGGKKRCEREADMFALRLLAPACVLHELHALDTDSIAALCSIPRTAAGDRARRMATLERRARFYQSPLERELRCRFNAYIEDTLRTAQ